MKQLGIGVQVWIGWAPDTYLQGDGDCRFQRGRIIDGPYHPGQLVEVLNVTTMLIKTAWIVSVFCDSSEVLVSEELLTPIDDDDANDSDELVVCDVERAG